MRSQVFIWPVREMVIPSPISGEGSRKDTVYNQNQIDQAIAYNEAIKSEQKRLDDLMQLIHRSGGRLISITQVAVGENHGWLSTTVVFMEGQPLTKEP